MFNPSFRKGFSVIPQVFSKREVVKMPLTILDEGVEVCKRNALNFIGDLVTATDDAVNSRADVTISNPTWAQVDKTISSIADMTTKSHTLLSDIGTNTHAQVDTHVSSTSNPHSATLDQVTDAGNITTNNIQVNAVTIDTTGTVVDAPLADTDLVNKAYVDAEIAAIVIPEQPTVSGSVFRYEFYNSGYDTQYQFTSTAWLCQTFTVGTLKNNNNFTLYSVKLRMYKTGTTGTVTVKTYGVDANGKPSGAALTSDTFDGDADLGTATAGTWKEIVMAASVVLASSTKYAIVVSATDTGGRWKADASSPTYTGGSYGASADSGSTWTMNTARDFMFEVWGSYNVAKICKVQTSVQANDTRSNSTSELLFATSWAVPVNFLTAGKNLRVIARGVHTSDGAKLGTLRIKLRIGTTVLGDTAAFSQTSPVTNAAWELRSDITCISAGNPGTVEAQGLCLVEYTTGAPILRSMVNTAVVNLDTTTGANLQISVQFSQASATNSITMRQFIVEAME